MNSLDVIRKAVEDVEYLKKWIAQDQAGLSMKQICESVMNMCDDVTIPALSYLKTGGWLDYPQNIPAPGLYACEVSDSVFPECLVWSADGIGNEYWDTNGVKKYCPLPPLPSDKPEELHGKDGG